MTHTVLLKGREVRYELQRKRVKNINLRIKPDMSVYVSASPYITVAEIERFMREKEDLILRALDRFSESGAERETPQYENGDIVQLLGTDYPLRVEEGGKNAVLFDGKTAVLRVKNAADLELKRKTLDKWLRESCRETVEESCRRLYPVFEKQGVPWPEIRIRTMKSKWGSCMPQKKVLTFNTNLIAAPQECVDYVVAHEFTHFLHPDHSEKFYASLAETVPDWKRLRMETNRHLVVRKAKKAKN